MAAAARPHHRRDRLPGSPGRCGGGGPVALRDAPADVVPGERRRLPPGLGSGELPDPLVRAALPGHGKRGVPAGVRRRGSAVRRHRRGQPGFKAGAGQAVRPVRLSLGRAAVPHRPVRAAPATAPATGKGAEPLPRAGGRSGTQRCRVGAPVGTRSFRRVLGRGRVCGPAAGTSHRGGARRWFLHDHPRRIESDRGRHRGRRRLVGPHAGRSSSSELGTRGQRRLARGGYVAHRHRRAAHPYPTGLRAAAVARRGARVHRWPPAAEVGGGPQHRRCLANPAVPSAGAVGPARAPGQSRQRSVPADPGRGGRAGLHHLQVPQHVPGRRAPAPHLDRGQRVHRRPAVQGAARPPQSPGWAAGCAASASTNCPSSSTW